MLDPLLDALAGPGEWLNRGRWIYALVNAAHILGIACLFGAILPLDLRLLGCWPGVAARELARVLVPVAAAGLLLALASGVLLFSVDPHYYAGVGLFRVKLVLIGLALLNLALLHRGRAWRALLGGLPIAGRLRLAGLLSAGLWLAAIICGRFIAYV